MQASQNPLQKAERLLDDGKFAAFFQLLDEQGNMKGISDLSVFNRLRRELLIEGVKVDYSQRLKMFAYEALKDVPLPTQARFLTNFYRTDNFIGRAQDLDDLHQRLASNQPTVVVNGMGGIGKTALAKKYVQDYQHHYDHIVWLNQQTTLLDAFINAPRLSENFHFTNEDKIIRFLKNKPGKNLLVVDNYERVEEETTKYCLLAEFKEIRFQHWHLLFTSRQKNDQFQTLELNTLPLAEAQALFEKHCPHKTVEEAKLHKVLEMIDYHTLTIELLAKNYANSWDLDDLQQVIDILEKKELDNDSLQEKIKIGQDAKEIRLYTHLAQIFNVKPLGEDAIYLLKQFAVLPNQAISGKQLLTWLNDPDRKYHPALKALAQKGWLASKDAAHFEMHRLIQMLMQKVLAPTFQDNEVLFQAILSELDEDKVKVNPLSHQYLLSYAKAFLANLNFPTNDAKKGYLQFRLAKAYVDLGMYERAEVLYEQVLALRKATLGESHPTYATVLNNLALLYHYQGKYEQAILLCRQALVIRQEVLGESHPDYATSLNNMAGVYYAQGDYDQAVILYQQALAIRKEVLGEMHPDYATSLNNLAELYYDKWHFSQAMSLYQQALAIRKEVLGEMHPDYVASLNNLAELYDAQGDYTQAAPLYQQALAIRKEILGELHPDYVASLNNLSLAYSARENYAQAILLCEQALVIHKVVLGEMHPNYATYLNELALLYRAQGDYAQAAYLHQQALVIRKTVLGELHHDYLNSLYSLISLYEAEVDYDQAAPLREQALAIRKRRFG